MNHPNRAPRSLVAAAAVAVVALTGSHTASAQHVTPTMAMMMRGSPNAGATRCEDQARQAAQTLEALDAGLARARATGEETAVRAALDVLRQGLADVKGRLDACRAGATTQAPAVGPGMAGMDHSKMTMGGAQPPAVERAGAAAAPTTVRQIDGPAEAALQAFTNALQIGNRNVALEWLAPEATISEAGATDASRDAYANGHMGVDMAFLKTARVLLLDRQVHPGGDSTHIVSTSRVTGRAGEVPVDVTVTEAALLKRTAQGWRIVSLQWTLEPVKADAR